MYSVMQGWMNTHAETRVDVLNQEKILTISQFLHPHLSDDDLVRLGTSFGLMVASRFRQFNPGT